MAIRPDYLRYIAIFVAGILCTIWFLPCAWWTHFRPECAGSGGGDGGSGSGGGSGYLWDGDCNAYVAQQITRQCCDTPPAGESPTCNNQAVPEGITAYINPEIFCDQYTCLQGTRCVPKSNVAYVGLRCGCAELDWYAR